MKNAGDIDGLVEDLVRQAKQVAFTAAPDHVKEVAEKALAELKTAIDAISVTVSPVEDSKVKVTFEKLPDGPVGQAIGVALKAKMEDNLK